MILCSLLCLAAIALWTHGASPLAEVERRIPRLAKIADEAELPLAALVALAWLDARRAVERGDLARAKALHAALEAKLEDPIAAFDLLVLDPVERRMTIDLMQRKAKRWWRLASQ